MSVAVFFIVTTILLADQACKIAIMKHIGLNASRPLIKDILYLTPSLNTGGGFGIFPDQTLLFIFLSILTIICIIILIAAKKINQSAHIYLFSMILAGASGNLIDRVRIGAVIDFIDFKIWPVFNIADSSITIGVALLIWHMLFENIKNQKHAKVHNKN